MTTLHHVLTVTRLIAVSGCCVLTLPALAEMTLDVEQSSVSMVSTKVLADGTTSVSERFSFNTLTGTVDDDGNATVNVMLDSIETGIDIRNERMAEYLFEVADFPDATISATIPGDVLSSGATMMDLTATLMLHGKESEINVPVAIAQNNGQLMVSALEPVLLDANAHDLGAGLGKLAELAKLLHIPTTVPVSFNLTFDKTGS